MDTHFFPQESRRHLKLCGLLGPEDGIRSVGYCLPADTA